MAGIALSSNKQTVAGMFQLELAEIEGISAVFGPHSTLAVALHEAEVAAGIR